MRHVKLFVNAIGPHCRLLITTRDSDLATALGAQEFRLDVLSDDQALALLAQWAGQEAQALPPEAREVAQECGNLPLALAMIGALARAKPDRWENALHKLRQADLEQIGRQFPNYEHPNLLRAIQVSVEALAAPEVQQRFPNIQARYLDFAVFPQGTPIPESVLGVFWAPEGLDRFQTQDVADFLVERSLAQRDERNRLMLHDLQFDYVRIQVPDLPARRHALLSAYAAQCPVGDPLLFTLSGHEGTVHSLTITPDGRWGITASSSSLDRTVRLWDLATGIELRTLAGQADAGFNPVGLTPDGRWALCARGSDIHVWNVATGEQACVMQGHGGQITALAVATEGKRAISAADDGKLSVWDLDNWKKHAELPGSQEAVYAVSITPNGRAAVSASPGTLKLWGLDRLLEASMLQVEIGFHDAGQSSPWQHSPLALSPDGGRVFVGSSLHIWDVGSGDLLPIFDTVSPGQVLGITPDGRVALASQDNQTIDVWDVERMVRLVILPGQRSPISTLALTPDGLTVVVALFDHYIKVWALENRATSVASPRPGNSVDVTRDGRWAVSVDEGEIVAVWDLKDGQPVSPSPMRDSVVQEMHTLWQERAVHYTKADELIRRYHSEISRAEEASEESEAKPTRLVVLPIMAEWKAMAANSQRALAVLHERAKTSEADETGEPVERYAIEVWRFDAPDNPVIMYGHSSPVTAVAITPDGHRAVSGCIGRTLRVWDLETGKELRTLRGHQGTIWDVKVTPDGQYLVSASEDRTVRVWNPETGQNVATFTGQLPMKSCAVGQDGRMIVACDSLGQVHFLRLQGQTGSSSA